MDGGTLWSAVGAIGTCVAAVVAVLAYRNTQQRPTTERKSQGDAPPPPATPTPRPATQQAWPPSLSEWPAPLDIRRVVAEKELVAQILDALANIRPDGTFGGITIGKPGKPRAMIYVGHCPINTDAAIRRLAKPYRYNVSPVRNLAALESIATATRDDPKGY